jgi:hypothetical protein
LADRHPKKQTSCKEEQVFDDGVFETDEDEVDGSAIDGDDDSSDWEDSVEDSRLLHKMLRCIIATLCHKQLPALHRLTQPGTFKGLCQRLSNRMSVDLWDPSKHISVTKVALTSPHVWIENSPLHLLSQTFLMHRGWALAFTVNLLHRPGSSGHHAPYLHQTT